MNKIERILITILAIALCAWLLFPTLKWYTLTTEEDRTTSSSSLSVLRDKLHSAALKDISAIKAKIGTDEDLSDSFPMQVSKAKDAYKSAGKAVPSKWTSEAILGAFESEESAVRAFEDYYRTYYLNLKSTSAKALKLGLDLRGGMSVLLEGDVDSLERRLEHTPSGDEIASAIDQDIEILRTRIDQYGVSEAEIRRQGNDQILVEVPGNVDPERVQGFIRGQGSLKFAIVNQEQTEELLRWKDEHYSELFDENGKFIQPSFIKEGFTAAPYYVNDEYGLEVLREDYPCAVIDDAQTMDASYITSVEVQKDQYSNQPVVAFHLNSQGGDLFYELTSKNVKGPLAVVMDGKIKSIATIQQALSTNVQVTGFSEKEAEDLKVVLQTTSFPIELSIASEERVGASLGEDAIRMALIALSIGLCIIILFLIIYYRLPGLLASFMLVLDVYLIIAVLSALGFTLTLTSIAGLILTLGMSVDSVIIIFERIKEELQTGKDTKNAINTAFSRATWTLLDANITTMIAAIVLSFLGSAQVKGFANTLAVGIVCSLFTMLFVMHMLIDLFVTSRKHGRIHIGRIHMLSEEALQTSAWEGKKVVPVRKMGYAVIVISSVFFIVGAVFFGVKGGFNLGIDFESGYMATVEIDQSGRDAVRIDEVRGALDSSYSVQNRGDSNNGVFIIKTSADDQSARETVSENMLKALSEKFGEGKVSVIAENFIGAKFSSSLIRGSLIGIAVALIFMLIYIWIRFRLSYAISSVLALLHDVALLLAFVSFTRIEISSVTIAAILTIIGYSINNTIVIFDRVRENIQLSNGKGDFNEIVERSVTQSLKRTLFSSFTTIVAVLPVAIAVSSEIRMFAVCLIVGILIGLYSANFVSPNILRLFSKIKNPQFDPMKIKLKTKNN